MIKVFKNNESVNAASTFLNISNRVTSGGELGLLGLAFPRQFNRAAFFMCIIQQTIRYALSSLVSLFYKPTKTKQM